MYSLLLFLFGLGFETLRELELNNVLLGARTVPGTDQNDQNTELDEMYRASKEVVENINHS